MFSSGIQHRTDFTKPEEIDLDGEHVGCVRYDKITDPCLC